MNYHIITQDKFFDSYIEDIYKLHQENNNVFWVRGNRGDTDLLKTHRPISYLGDDKDSIINKLQCIKSHDRLIVSWYDVFIGDCILTSKITCNVYAYLMGGDFYNDPGGYHNYWLYDYHTKKIVDKIYLPKINFKRKPKNWYKILKEIKARINYRRNITKAYHLKLKTIGRIDYIITSPHNEGEIDLVKHLYPTFRAKYIFGSFNQNYEIAKDFHFANLFNGNRPLKVLLGNSADPCNNHIDACEFLLKVLPKNSVINCPLSYGDAKYSMIFQKWANNHLQSKIHPILDFMDRRKYVEFLNSMDIVVMYHNRQQAFGNIVTSLCLGKPVFLKKDSPVFQMLTSIGIPNIYSTERLFTEDISDICKIAYESRSLTVSILKKCFSEEARLNDLRGIIMCNNNVIA